MKLHLLQLENCPVLQQLRYEEALLRVDQRNWCLINQGSPPAIVMGISGQLEELIELAVWQQKPVPVIRRFSGGGTVFVDEETLFVTFIFNQQALPVHPYPETIMRWTEALYRPLFAPHPFALLENDYVMGHLKFGGNAQSIIKQRWLHHSSFLWNYQPSNMNYLRLPLRRPHYRKSRPHTDFLCKLSDLYPCRKNLQQKLVNLLQQQYEIERTTVQQLDALLTQPHRQATQLLMS